MRAAFCQPGSHPPARPRNGALEASPCQDATSAVQSRAPLRYSLTIVAPIAISFHSFRSAGLTEMKRRGLAPLLMQVTARLLFALRFDFRLHFMPSDGVKSIDATPSPQSSCGASF